MNTEVVIRLASNRQVCLQMAGDEPVEIVEVIERGPSDPDWSPPMTCANDESKQERPYRARGEYVYRCQDDGGGRTRRPTSARRFAQGAPWNR